MLVQLRRIGLNEVKPVLGIFAHQPVNEVGHHRAAFIFVRKRDADQRARRRVHRRFAQLAGVHLAEAFEAADVDLFALEHGRLQFSTVRIVGGVNALAAVSQAIQRRARQKQMTGADDLGHFLKEIGHQQGCNMRAVDIGVGHDDDAFIAQIVGVAVLSNAAAKRQLKVGDFAVGSNFLKRGRCDVEDFTPDR